MDKLLCKFRYRSKGLLVWLLWTAIIAVWSTPIWIRLLGMADASPQAKDIALHLMQSVLFALGFVCFDGRKGQLWGAVGFCTAAMLPGAGLVLTWAAVILIPEVDITVFEEEELAKEEAVQIKRSRLVREVDELGRTGLEDQCRVEQLVLNWVDLTSIDDILKGDDLMKKRSAIAALAQSPTSMAIQTLRRMLRDENADICFCASSALLKIEEKLTEESSVLRDRIEADPEDSDSRISLAEVYLRAVELGLLPKVTREQRLEEILDLLEDVQDSSERRQLETRVYLAQGAYSRLIDEFGAGDADDPQTLYALCDAYLHQGQHNKLRETSERLAKLFWNSGDNKLYDVSCWSTGHANGQE